MARGQMRLRKRSMAPSQTQKKKGTLQAKSNAMSQNGQDRNMAISKDSPLVRSGNILKRMIERDQQQAQGETTQDTQPKTPLPIQAKLEIGDPQDSQEQQADHVARQVVRSIGQPQRPRQSVQRQIVNFWNRPSIQRNGSGVVSGAASPAFESKLQRARGGGQPLPPNFRSQVEPLMGADFSGVRVHTDTQSNHLNQTIQAKAFTTGQDVFFKRGAYNPGSQGGQELIAHELTHVMQQGGANPQTAQRKEADNNQLPEQPLAPIGQSTSPVVQRYIDFTAATKNSLGLSYLNGLGSENGAIVWRGKQAVYATKEKIDESNEKLENSGSFIHLEEDGLLRKKQRQDIGELYSLSTTPNLYKATPKWREQEDSGIHKPVQQKNKENEKLQLWQDCRKSSAAVMGSRDVDREIEYEVNNAIERIRRTEPGELLNELYTAMIPVFLLSNESYIQNVHRKDNSPEEDLKVIVKSKDQTSGKTNQRTKMYCRDAYAAMPPDAQNAFDQQYGIGKYALPDVGEGYSIVTKWDVEGFETKSKNTFGYHWGGVIMQDGNDRLTLEQASRGLENEITDNWELNLYGIEEGQSFQEKQDKTRAFGNKHTTIRVKNPQDNQDIE